MEWIKGASPEQSGYYSIIYKLGSEHYALPRVSYSKKHDAWNCSDNLTEDEAKQCWWKEDGTEVIAYSKGNFVQDLISEVLGNE